MNDKLFLDTNLFIYTFDSHSPQKQATAKKIVETSLVNHVGCISYQVVQEFSNAAIKKFRTPLSVSDCRRYVSSVLEPLCEVFFSFELYRHALDIHEQWKYSFYDSLIIAAAIQSDCTTLYSEDLQDGRTIQNISIKNPFK